MSDPEDTASDFEEFDSSFGPEFDSGLDDDVDEAPGKIYVQAAWQRLDERKDDKWLKEQLADWDDWDDIGDDAGLH